MRPGWRLAVVGTVFLALFSILGLRLWYLQVSSIASATETVQEQQLRTVSVPAPRGDIFDANGEKIAGTVAELRIVVDRKLLPDGAQPRLIANLSALLDVPASELRAEFEDHELEDRFALNYDITESVAAFTLEHLENFPGVVVEPLPVRIYPQGESGAHIVGYIGAPSEDDLRRPNVRPDDEVGRFGVERFYDGVLRGTRGRTVYQVNASGDILGIVEEVAPVAGGSAHLTIDFELQRVLESALQDGINLAALAGETEVQRAVGVIMDPRDGSIYAMASVPSFDPSLFTDGEITDEEWARITERAALNNFAIQGLFPPASTFKAIPYSLALERGDIYPTTETDEYAEQLDPTDPTSFFCDGQLLFPDTPPLNDWLRTGHGEVDINTSFQQSCDLYYWGIALEIWDNRGEGSISENLLQDWSRTLGFGERTGIDLPFEQSGLVPDREWFQYHQQNDTGVVRSQGGWSGGDLMNVAIGQGALTVTPLQLANAYAALINGGTLWQPRVVDDLTDADGRVIFTNPPSAIRTFPLAESTRRTLLSDMRDVVSGPKGTARVAFEDFGESLLSVGGKTGTAQIKIGETVEEDIDTAWFVGAGPIEDPEFVIVVVIDQGGSGGRIAAPVARRVMQYMMGEEMDPIRPGQEQD